MSTLDRSSEIVRHEADSSRPRAAGDRLRESFLPEQAGTVSSYFRARRWSELCRRFPNLAEMSVVDLGGYAWNWMEVPVRPKSVLVINLDDEKPGALPTWIETIHCDACQLPPDLLERRFDLVYSNSLLEHVGGYWRRVAIAKSVHQLADHHWIQTPWRYFPFEPHWMVPCFQFLPVRVRAGISRSWPLAPREFRASGLDENIDSVLQVELVSTTEMRRLFPRSAIYRERVAGITKSITAVL